MTGIVPQNDGSFVATGRNWTAQFDVPKPGLFTLEIAKNLKLTSRFVLVDSLEESTALQGRRKTHFSNDGTETCLETESTIPFGAEPSINRKYRLSEGLMTVTTDFLIRPSFAIRNLFAGGYMIEGAVTRYAILEQPKIGVDLPKPDWKEFESTERGSVLYDSTQPPVSLLLETIDGFTVELSTGEDFWRWIATQPHTASRYTITRTISGFEVAWIPFEFKPHPEAEVPAGRSRRMNFIIAWKKKTKTKKTIKAKDTFDMGAFDWPESCLAQAADGTPVKGSPCFAAPGVTNILKKWLRRNLADLEEDDILTVKNVSPVFCHAAAHQDRAKQKILPHLDLFGINEFSLWANRQLARKGAKLVIVPAAEIELPSVGK